MTVEAGDGAPPFSMPATDGGEVSLADYAGKRLALYFYPRDATPGCTREAQDFRDLHEAFSEAGVSVLGVSPILPRSHDRFRAKHDLPFALGSDEDHAVAEAYGVWVEKSLYGKKYMGVERSTFLIDAGGRVERVWRKVRVKDHARAVLAAAQDTK